MAINNLLLYHVVVFYYYRANSIFKILHKKSAAQGHTLCRDAAE